MEWEASTRWQRWRVNPEDANDGMEDAIPPSQPRHPERMGEAGLSTFEGEKATRTCLNVDIHAPGTGANQALGNMFS